MNDSTERIEEARTRRFRRYREYTDSGIEWLGEIPAHWEVKPLKHLMTFSTGWTPPTGREDLYGGEHLWANISDLGPKVLDKTENTISDLAITETGLRKVEAGSLLFSFKLSIGAESIAGLNMYTNEAIAAFTPSVLMNTGYLYWAAPVLVPRSAQENIYGAPLLNRERIANAKLLCLALPEQRAIATFLDRETARIDGLVARKERLIELLQEKRTALITRAVTRGLDPNVSMRDSGVEWLGEIPARWHLRPLKRVSPEITVGVVVNPSTYVQTKGVPFLYGSDIREGHIVADGARRMSEEDSESLSKSCLRAGDLVCVRVGAPGITAVVPPELAGANCASVLIVRRGDSFDSHWLCYAMNSRLVRFQVELVQYGAAQEQFNVAHAVEFFVPLASQAEQRAIAAFLDRETARIDALIAKIRQAIDHLKEFRSALISAAVTGKIDVRAASAGTAVDPGGMP